MTTQFRPELEAGVVALYEALHPITIGFEELPAHEREVWCQAAIAFLKAVPVSADLVMAMHGKSTPIPATKGSKLYESFKAAIRFLTEVRHD